MNNDESSKNNDAIDEKHPPQEKSFFDEPSGKNFLTLIAAYTFFITILSLTIEKNWFIFLTTTSYFMLVDAVIIFIQVCFILLISYNDPRKAKSFEESIIFIIIQIVAFLTFSHFLNFIALNQLLFRIFSLLLLAVLFSLSFLFHTYNYALFSLSFCNETTSKHTLIYKLYRFARTLVAVLFVFLVNFVLLLFISRKQNSMYILDVTFFWELLSTVLLLFVLGVVDYIISLVKNRFEKTRKILTIYKNYFKRLNLFRKQHRKKIVSSQE